MTKLKVKVSGIFRDLHTEPETVNVIVPDHWSMGDVRQVAKEEAYLDDVTEVEVLAQVG